MCSIKKSLLLFAAILLTVSSASLTAERVTQTGIYYEEGQTWYQMQYEDDTTAFIAAFPAKSRLDVKEDFFISYCEFNRTYFGFHTFLPHYSPPSSMNEFMDSMLPLFDGKRVHLHPFHCDDPQVVYAVDAFVEGSDQLYPQMIRILCSENRLFICVVSGADLSLAPSFFDTIMILK